MGINRSKRTFTFLLALTLVLTTVPAPISAEETAEPAKCPCCETAAEWVEVNSQTENPFSEPGHYRLTENVTLQGENIVLDWGITLDLNGFHLYAPEGYRAFSVSADQTLNVVDLSETANGAIIGNTAATAIGGVLYVKGTLNLYSGRLVIRNFFIISC